MESDEIFAVRLQSDAKGCLSDCNPMTESDSFATKSSEKENRHQLLN